MINDNIKRLFKIKGKGIKLQGGQNQSYLFGDKVLKPFEGDISFTNLTFDIVNELNNPMYRVSNPIKSINGNYIEEGYICTRYKEGYEDDFKVKEQLHICRIFHNDLSKYDVKIINNEDDPWSKAFKVIFDDVTLIENINPLEKGICMELYNQISIQTQPRQLIHGDFGGNVLFSDDDVPLIIDFSFNYAPKELADAIMICDLYAWTDNDIEIIDLLQKERYQQYIIAAILFRYLAVSFNQNCDHNRFLEEVAAYQPILNYIK